MEVPSFKSWTQNNTLHVINMRISLCLRVKRLICGSGHRQEWAGPESHKTRTRGPRGYDANVVTLSDLRPYSHIHWLSHCRISFLGRGVPLRILPRPASPVPGRRRCSVLRPRSDEEILLRLTSALRPRGKVSVGGRPLSELTSVEHLAFRLPRRGSGRGVGLDLIVFPHCGSIKF